MTGNRPVTGILLMTGFCALAPLADGIAKLLGERWPILLLVTVRFVAPAVLLWPVVALTGRRVGLDARGWLLVVVRTALHIAGITAIFLSLRFLPVAEALAIAYVMPFLLLAFGRLALGEEVGRHRLAACGVGFLGTLLVVQPNFAAVGAPALLPLGAAVVFSGFVVITRGLSRRIDAITLQALGGTLALPALLPPLLLVDLALPPAPDADWPLLVALGVTGTLAHLLMTWSLRFAPAATLAPMQYLEIPFATLVGLAMFGDLPDGLAALGIVVTMSAGLYIVARERRISRQASPTPPTAAAGPPSAG